MTEQLVLKAQGREWRLDDPARIYTLGRNPDSDVYLDDQRVSSRHAVIAHGATGWTLSDKGSTNGTFLNGRKVGAITLTPGASVVVGGETDGVAIAVEAVGDAPAPPPPPPAAFLPPSMPPQPSVPPSPLSTPPVPHQPPEWPPPIPAAEGPPAVTESANQLPAASQPGPSGAAAGTSGGGWQPPPPLAPTQWAPPGGPGKKRSVVLIGSIAAGSVAVVVAVVLVLTMLDFNGDDSKGTGTAGGKKPEPSATVSVRPASTAKVGDPVTMDRVYKITERAPLQDGIDAKIKEGGGWKFVPPFGEDTGQDTYNNGIGPGKCSMTITPGTQEGAGVSDPNSDKPGSVGEQDWWLGYVKKDAVGGKVTVKNVAPRVLPLGSGGVEMDTREMSYSLPGFGPQRERNLMRTFGTTRAVLQLDFLCEGKKLDEKAFKQAMSRVQVTVSAPGKDYTLDDVVPIEEYPSISFALPEPEWLASSQNPNVYNNENGCIIQRDYYLPDPKAVEPKVDTKSDRPGTEAEIKRLEDWFVPENVEESTVKKSTGEKQGATKVTVNKAGQTAEFVTWEHAMDYNDGTKGYEFFIRRVFNAPKTTVIGATLFCRTKDLVDKQKEMFINSATVRTTKE